MLYIWFVFYQKPGFSPGGYLGQVDAPNKESAIYQARLLFGNNILVESRGESAD